MIGRESGVEGASIHGGSAIDHREAKNHKNGVIPKSNNKRAAEQKRKKRVSTPPPPLSSSTAGRRATMEIACKDSTMQEGKKATADGMGVAGGQAV